MAGAANAQHIIIADRAMVKTLAVIWPCFLVIFLANIAALLNIYLSITVCCYKKIHCSRTALYRIYRWPHNCGSKFINPGFINPVATQKFRVKSRTGKAPWWH
jgi:hypothetical protein